MFKNYIIFVLRLTHLFLDLYEKIYFNSYSIRFFYVRKFTGKYFALSTRSY